MIPLKSGTRQGCPLFLYLFNIVPEVLARAVRNKRRSRDTNQKEEVKLSLFADGVIVYIKDPKNSNKLIELINTFSNVAGYMINSKKSVALLNTDDKWSEKEIRETLPFTITTKAHNISE